MATTPVTLKVKGFAEREVSKVLYSFDQAIDKENQPAGIPRGGLITIKVKAMNDGNAELLKWMTSKTLHKDGSIVFMTSTDSHKQMKEVEFKKAYCIKFTETWEDKIGNSELAHFEEITISCQEIKNGPAEYQNEWK